MMHQNDFRAKSGEVHCTATVPCGGQPLLQEAIEARRVELAQGVGIGIGKIDDDRVESGSRPGEPDHGILVDDFHPRIVEGAAVQFGQRLKVVGKARHLGIEIDQRDCFHRRDFEDLAQGQPVAAAQTSTRRGRPARARAGWTRASW